MKLKLPQSVTICDVSPRDGLQSIAKQISTADKIQLVNRLAEAGLTRIEVGSFVHPKLVPQMASTGAVLADILRVERLKVRALVPNLVGAELAREANVDELLLLLVASETFQRKNVGKSVFEVLASFDRVMSLATTNGMHAVGGIGTAFGCPFEGAVPVERVLSIIEGYVAMGLAEISLADTTGMADPAQVYALCCRIRDRWPELQIGLHFHNTRGLGLANVLAGLQAGVRQFDASIGGLGGCPFAPKATGNICTADLVHMLDSLNISSGINLEALLEVAHWLRDELELETPGLVMRAGPRSKLHPA